MVQLWLFQGKINVFVMRRQHDRCIYDQTPRWGAGVAPQFPQACRCCGSESFPAKAPLEH